MASRANDSDGGGSLTPSEQSDGEDRSEHDSDYETDDGKEEEDDSRDRNLNIIWTGYGKKIPVILFNASSILNKHTNFKAVGGQYHMAFKFGGAECKIIRNILMAHGFQEVHQNCSDFNVAWTSCHLKPFTLRSLTEFQKINHFPRSSELTRKDRLYKNIQRMQQIKGIKHFDFVPQTYVMPNEYQEFCSQFLKDRGPWIVKPVASSRGRGVFLVNHPDQVPFDENVIVSQYLQNPLVIDGFKFDIRLYVAVTSYDPLVIYLYEEGLTRFATVKYERSTKHLRNQCMHLTNYSVNKKSNDYVKNDDPDVEDYGNKWSMGAMLRYLRSIGKDTAALMMRIEDVVIKTLLSVELSIATACKMFMPYRGNCFELYGFDILVDDCLKPWVLEVNLSPSLACDSPLDLKIKGNMLCDLFSLTGIVCHDPMVRSLQHQSRRNQDLIRMTGRAKTALSRTGITRPKARPQSATHSSRTGSMTQGKTGMTGLNSEEIKIVRRVKEEEQRKGGWIRIFPSPDTWDVHGPFLQFSTTHNLMLHQRLYPERHKQMSLKSYGGSSISAAARSRNGYLQVMGTGQRLETDKSIESYTLAMLRSRQYERKLGSRSKHRRKEYRQKDSRGQLVQGMTDDLEDGENQSDEDYEQIDSRGRPCEAEDRKPRRKELSKSSTTTSDSSQTQPPPPPSQPQPSKSVTEKRVQEVKVEVPHLVPPVLTRPTSPPHMKYDMVEVLMEGGTLSKVQVRSAFAMYLRRVRERLLSEGSPVETEETDTLNEQMDLVLRFLKRAAVNLQQTFRVVVPSRKLSLGDRRHILAKQLADFVHIYTRETEQLKHLQKCPERTGSQNHASQKTDSETSIDEDRFNHFISVASESDLEQMLTTYTKLNKSSTIFLGSSISASSSPAKPPHNPLPPPQAQRLEMMQHRRREAGEGDCQGPGRPGTTLRENSASCVDNHGAGSTGSLSRPASASSSSSAAVTAVSIYSQRLGRPLSASNYKSPALKLISRPSSAKPSPFSTSEPVVDTYNEEAIREALKRLTVKQQARQYSSGNSSIALKPTPSSQPAKEERHRRGSLSPLDEQMDHSTTHPGTLHCVGSRPSSGASRSHQGSRGDSNRDRGKFTVSHPVSLTQSEVYVSKTAQAQGDPEAQVDYVSLSSTSSRPGSRAQSEDQVSLPERAPSQSGSVWSSHPKPSYGLSCSDQNGAEKAVQRKGSGRENARQGKPPLPGKGDRGGRLGSCASTSSVSCSTDALGEHLLSKHASLAIIGHPPSQSPLQPQSLWGGVDLAPERCSQTTQRERTWVKPPEQHGHMLMEANKAKHHAMVAQAHAAQRGSGSRRPLREASKPPHATETEASIARGTPTFNPKPPAQPASSRTPQSVPHRMTRLSSVENLSLGVGFQNSLKCHLYTQHRRKTETNAGH